MKLELDLNSSQKTVLINHPENDLGSEDVKKMLRSGISFAKEGNRVEARQMLLGVTEVEPNNETAWLWLASISEYPEELLVFLQNVLKVNPENERALEWAKQTKSLLSKTFVQRGINAAQNNQKEFAKQCFLQGIVHDSENEMAWLWLASTSESQEEKVSHLHQVLRINPENETALSSLSAVKTQMSQGLLKKANSAAISGDHETARQTLNAIMKNSPNIEDAWILKAFLATDFYEKIECYEKALEINPQCEAAQAGLSSLQMLMPKMPKPAVEEAAKVEEVAVAQAVVEEAEPVKEEAEPVKEEVVEIVKEEVVEAVKEEVVEEEVAAQAVTEESIEFDEGFDLEKLAEESPVETVEFAPQVSEEFVQEEPQPESRAFAEEVLLERQEEEAAIHETQTTFKETVFEAPVEPKRVESIFNYDEVIAQEEAFAEEKQAEAVLEFDESSDRPTQELDEEFAQTAAASFGLSVEEETLLETEPENTPGLEDFYTEQSANEVVQNAAEEESAVVEPKAEVRITETYDKEVNASEIYDSEFFANDGFVLVPQNDPFADHRQETVEFSYSETEGVKENSGAEETVETVETQSVEQVVETQAVEEFAQAVEPVQQVAEPVQQLFETAPQAEESFAQVTEQVAEAPQVELADQYTETEPVAEQVYEQASELHSSEQVEVLNAPTQFEELVEDTQEVEQVVETQYAEQFEAAAEFQPIEKPVEHFEQTVAAEYFEAAEQTVEEQSVEQVEKHVEQIAATEQSTEVAEAVEFSQEEAVQESAPVEEVQPETQAEEIQEFAQTVQEAETVQFEQQTVSEVFETESYVPTQAESYAAQEESFASYQPAVETFTAPVPEIYEAPVSQAVTNQCPFCAAENENQTIVCNSCQAMLSLADLEMLISHQGVNQDLLLQAIEKMEVEKSLREFDVEELTFLAIAHLNAKNLEKGLGYLKDASALNPNDVILTSKIKFLTAHLEELKANKTATIGKNRTILVVDDSPTVRKLISGKLEKCGHSVLAAIDGMDALAKINEVIPDLILLDITMPRLDGYQVCKLIRNNEMTKDVPIIMISGKDGFFDKVRGRMAGSSGYITKPFGPDTLMKTIETYLN